MTAEQRFPFRFDPRYRTAARPFGVTEDRAWIAVDGEQLRVRYGPWHVATPLANIARVATTGPYRFLKTAGPAHLGITDRGLTFASNGERGVLLEFHTPITGIDAFGLVKHPNLTVTPADVDGMARALGG